MGDISNIGPRKDRHASGSSSQRALWASSGRGVVEERCASSQDIVHSVVVLTEQQATIYRGQSKYAEVCVRTGVERRISKPGVRVQHADLIRLKHEARVDQVVDEPLRPVAVEVVRIGDIGLARGESDVLTVVGPARTAVVDNDRAGVGRWRRVVYQVAEVPTDVDVVAIDLYGEDRVERTCNPVRSMSSRRRREPDRGIALRASVGALMHHHEVVWPNV